LKTDKNITKRLLCIAVALVCVFSSVFVVPKVAAKTVEELNQEIEEIEKDIQENQEKLDEVEQDIKTNEDKLKDLNGQIDKINTQIDLLDEKMDLLNEDIDTLNESIDLTTGDINKINGQIADIETQVAETEALMTSTREMLLARIRESYMSGEASTLELLFTSGDLATFFARKELVTRVSEEDSKLIAQLTEKIAQLDELQKKHHEVNLAVTPLKVIHV
jgi:peptidoglycan hydrolase CwlO-like protein